ncbi:860_t:CDS:2, partial [Funneliformis mosseae]
YVHSQETLNEGIKLPASSKRGNETTEKDISKRKKVKKTRKSVKSDLQPGNGRSSESPLSDE